LFRAACNFRDSIALHSRQHMAVKVERNADAGMPEPLLCNLWMDTPPISGVAWLCRDTGLRRFPASLLRQTRVLSLGGYGTREVIIIGLLPVGQYEVMGGTAAS